MIECYLKSILTSSFTLLASLFAIEAPSLLLLLSSSDLRVAWIDTLDIHSPILILTLYIVDFGLAVIFRRCDRWRTR
jgi:hypothetical protein